MPRPALPPTPGSSTDIKAKDGARQLSSLHPPLELPPPAIHDASRTSPTDAKHTSPTEAAYPSSLTGSSPPAAYPQYPYPLQPAETVKSRRRPQAAKGPKDDRAFALPPPPTRSRKIIQMKPRAAPEEAAEAAPGKSLAKSGGKGAAAAAAAAAPPSTDKGKRKQPSTTSAAGRKIARKTAHSLIERRRRSKMNEEFAVLKSMIPACTGEMHKLAILQASIDYVRYLEDCVAKLKAQHGGQDQARAPAEPSHDPLPPIRRFPPHPHEHAAADVDMSDSDTASPRFVGHADASHPSPASPTSHAHDSRHRQHSYSSASTDQRHYGYTTSAATSPAFGPQRHHGRCSQGNISSSASTLTSPALNPQSDLDQEATAALLMLNSDGRGTAAGGRGLSVRDLLST